MSNTNETIFSPNSSIDNAIKELLPNFSTVSQGRMRKAILNAKKAAVKHQDENTDSGARHIFREFIPASILNQNGFTFEYEKTIQGKTPDWLDEAAKMMIESYTYERGGSSKFINRISSSITDKCNKYKDIVTANSFHLIVAVYLDFLTGMSCEDCREDSEAFRSLFNDNDSLWAILFFTETMVIGGKQQYEYLCLCADSTFMSIPNWPFKTIGLNP